MAFTVTVGVGTQQTTRRTRREQKKNFTLTRYEAAGYVYKGHGTYGCG